MYIDIKHDGAKAQIPEEEYDRHRVTICDQIWLAVSPQGQWRRLVSHNDPTTHPLFFTVVTMHGHAVRSARGTEYVRAKSYIYICQDVEYAREYMRVRTFHCVQDSCVKTFNSAAFSPRLF